MRNLIQRLIGRRPGVKGPKCCLCIPCKVVKVYDVDTATRVEVKVELSVRYDNCWGPELNTEKGQEGKLAAKRAEGKEGILYVDLSDCNNLSDLFTFGRVVGEIWLDGEEQSESQKMVSLGLASTTKKGKLGE